MFIQIIYECAESRAIVVETGIDKFIFDRAQFEGGIMYERTNNTTKVNQLYPGRTMGTNSEDLRSYLKNVETQHELLTITKAVDVEDEVPALCSETKVPTLFGNLKDYDGWRLADCLLRDRIQAWYRAEVSA